ncbi:4Fe-4S dicluster domain-containing protein [Candidatus Aerophobetes bacterium]|uniref:Ferredoxin n=1 Tax=Aerophobetes bacterium TaxID=2030807 RepID=A0A523VWG2_UNCAE|nr:MAG: 4Fe-4S dicluster domain-containing protein [Candidatus Aerophobetes bacterium]
MEKPVIDEDLCTGCEICIDECPNDCLELVDDVVKLVRPEACDGKGECAEVCPTEAIIMQEE